ncbi:hypothetical protein M501DRAFT_997793 [Patellaria atrata CBS 101060]|uniref:DUF7730 domain-containing protein n=1 Tax=Patellaria atrata CBS 101060 TaxID=1346257 RepID=A0A9P4S3R1_9PEZI|nr:hypothetical protein M501DRAFT_997793 [Patellaria atrata CBS 101060]
MPSSRSRKVLKGISWTVFCIVCSPLVCYYTIEVLLEDVIDKKKREAAKVRRREKKEHRERVPVPLPGVRPRRLSLPLCEPPVEAQPNEKRPIHVLPIRRKNVRQPAIVQTTLDQLQSPLFNTLPAEIRVLIYQYAIGNQTLHITHLNKRLGHIVCMNTSSQKQFGVRRHFCWGYETESKEFINGDPELFSNTMGEGFTTPSSTGSLLSLLKSCRRVYSEAISILYTRNIFAVKHIRTVIDLNHTILTSRLHQIRTLDLRWTTQAPWHAENIDNRTTVYDKRTWEHVWSIIARMDGLRNLKVEIGGPGLLEPAHVLAVLRPLYHVKQTNVFMVTIEDWRKKVQGDLPPGPFLLRSRYSRTKEEVAWNP